MMTTTTAKNIERWNSQQIDLEKQLQNSREKKIDEDERDEKVWIEFLVPSEERNEVSQTTTTFTFLSKDYGAFGEKSKRGRQQNV